MATKATKAEIIGYRVPGYAFLRVRNFISRKACYEEARRLAREYTRVLQRSMYTKDEIGFVVTVRDE